MDKYFVYRPLLDLIGFTEGTDKGDGYNETLAYGAYTGGDVNLVGMTLGQIDALQTKMLKHPKNSWNSSAIGRYQIVRTTLRNIRKTLGLSTSEKFDADMQDRLACFLLGQRGIDKYLSGRLSEDTMLTNLAKEWASLPQPNGKGYYGGQHAAVEASRVRDVLAQVKGRHKQGQPANVPVEVEKEVEKKIDWWTKLTGGGGIGALGIGSIFGWDWQTVLAWGGVAVVVVLMLILLKRQIGSAIGDIRKALS